MIRVSANLDHHRITALILAFVSIFISDTIKGLTFTSILYLGSIFIIHLYQNGFKIKYNYLSIIVVLNLFFLTLVIRGACSLNYKFVLKDFILKLPLLLIPIFTMYKGFLSKEKLNYVINFFLIIVLISATIDLLGSLIDNILFNHAGSFFYKDLTHLMTNQAFYKSWIYLTSFFLIERKIYNNSYKKNKAWYFYLTLIILSILLLLSRIFIIIMIVTYTIILINRFLENQRIRPLATFFSFTLFSLLIIFSNKYSKNRFKDLAVEAKSFLIQKNQRSTNPRAYIWNIGASIIKSNFILGLGVDMADNVLKSRLKSNQVKLWNGSEMELIYKRNFNYHNQFMQSFAELGFIGFSLILYLVIYPLFKVQPNDIAFIFLSISFFGFLTESVFERQVGVLYFSIMYSIFINLQKEINLQ
ncbi:MAG: O-antigen ligase domain-containing protein [Flavobacteriales bacterium TMED288]|nr:hypothetical protein [Flavobacteriales bacterium]RPG53039.1 MAG: O-antigen ligase domain-containing protein [Flavobacteriales bacterium TMED288]|tara:strand:+ start:615 stop:1862 length:1248 start_codon:yes stop_codon:yes gene_type:complete